MAVVARKTKRGIIYWVSVRLSGGAREWYRIGGDKREAHRSNARYREQVKAGTYQRKTQRSDRTTVGAYAESWAAGKTTRTAARDWQRIRDFVPKALQEKPIGDVTRADVVDLVEELKRTCNKPKTARNVYGAFRSMMTHAQLREVIDRDPCVLPRGSLPRVGKPRKVVYTPAEIARLTDPGLVGDRMAAYFAAALYTGARKGELCGLRWGDYDLGPEPLGALLIERQYEGAPLKTGADAGDRSRLVPVHPELAAALERWSGVWELLHRRPPAAADPVFPSADGSPMTESSSTKALAAAFKLAAVPTHAERAGHVIRHTFVTTARRRGANPDVVQVLTHNSAGKMIDAYTHWEWEPMCEAVLCVGYGATRGATPKTTELSHGSQLGDSNPSQSPQKHDKASESRDSKREPDPRKNPGKSPGSGAKCAARRSSARSDAASVVQAIAEHITDSRRGVAPLPALVRIRLAAPRLALLPEAAR